MPQAQFSEFANVPAATGFSDPIDVSDLTDKSVQVEGLTGTAEVHGRLDGASGFNLIANTAITNTGMVQIVGTYKEIKVRIVTYASGTPKAFLGARNDRTR